MMERENVVGEEMSPRQKAEHENTGKLKKKDLFDLEATGASGRYDPKAVGWCTIAKLAFQCIGVVYGDLGTSPLYVFAGIFPEGINDNEDLLGAMSLIFYLLVTITLIKYVFIVLAANDNGDGGTFALYSLICRHAKVNLMPNQQAEDRQVSNYKLDVPDRRTKMAAALKSLFEGSKAWKYVLLLMTMTGVSMVLGDGILTPVISVLSAVGGIKQAASSLTDTTVMWISVVILIFLFQIQRFGTDKVGYTFAPIILLWFLFISLIGIYNFFRYDPTVIKALNPWYIVSYFQRNGRSGWISLGGIMLCLTGSEALFADLGHFHIRSVQLSSCSVLLPSVLLAYFGQCSYLRLHNADVANTFYKSIPKPLYWPQFVLAVLAAIIASQSLISASFAIIQQSLALGCFPRVKVVHTSPKYEGQVYIPEINFFLMVVCVGVTFGFKNTLQIGNAYGLAVGFVFVITSIFLVMVMIMIWKTNPILIILYTATIGLIELVLLSSLFYKFVDGGYFPFIFGLVTIAIMFVWNYGHRKKYQYEVDNKVSKDQLASITSGRTIQRIPGVGLFYTELVQGVTPVFSHYVSNIPALHSVLVFVTIKSLPISRVPPEERFLFQRVNPDVLMFRCIVRYGYKDPRKKQECLEEILASQLKKFILEDGEGNQVQRELALVENALNDGTVYLMGEGEAVASKGSSCAKKFMVDYCYDWLNKSVRRPDEFLLIPHKRLLKVGMTYEV